MTTTTFSPVKGAQAAQAAIDLAVAYGYAAAAQYAAGAVPGRWKAARLNGAGSTPAAAPAATQPPAPPPAVGAPSGVAGVMACIRGHESGRYDEASHPSSGSGAYQFVPGTWRAWAARAGYPGYAYAYLAPASVQDAVTAYVLTHGGAGNWSNRFGFDPCTAGLPGGG